MKRILILVLILCFSLVGCNQKDASIKGEYDITGTITEVNTEGRQILVEDKQIGLVWISLHEEGDISTFQIGQTVAVWTDGKIRESYPAQTNALNIEILTTDNT
ncbi:DUF3221 domain-containing protein [Neobacillus sp. FSL H8-0543]|uniref:DUF3221 domain-containing protein n=1 Tax=Neobacillus sp. FSL H8-0543 TaxID=2954672 RepID=UPI0031596CAF